jgi:bacteriorhodopsin
MSPVLGRGNEALAINPPIGDNHLTVHGSDWLWAVTAVFVVSLFCFILLCGYAAKHDERAPHFLLIIAAFASAITYFAMASDLGGVPVQTSLNGANGATRQIWYPRYINWFVSRPMVATAVLLLSGVSWANVLFSIGLSWVWVCSWLAGAFVATTYKWGFFAFGIVGYMLLSGQLVYWARLSAVRVGSQKHYGFIAYPLVFFWLLYSIAWGLDEGGNKISVTSGFIFYGILDILSVAVLGFFFFFLSRGWDYGALGLQFTQYGRTVGDHRIHPEKQSEPVKAAEPATKADA